MKTVVFQSYRTSNVPPWISMCLRSVNEWSSSQGFDYQFIDDRLFDYVPSWYRSKVNNNMCLVTDLARLVLAEELLQQGYERTIWVDADVLIFEPNAFSIDITDGFAFCRELWLGQRQFMKWRLWRPTFVKAINNSISIFTKGTSFLPFYIEACKMMVRSKEVLRPYDVSTDFLTTLYKYIKFPVLEDVGIFSTPLLCAVAMGKNTTIRGYMRKHNTYLHAVNLCSSLEEVSFRNSIMLKRTADLSAYVSVVQKLLETKGAIINRFL